MKKIICFIIAFVLMFSFSFNLFAETDNKIFTDTVQNIYTGTDEAKSTIENLNFTDVPSGYWAKESIVRAGALNMIKGYDKRFSPSATVSNEEAIAFVVRIMGLENQAQQEAARLQNIAKATAAANPNLIVDPNSYNPLTDSNSVLPIWSIGYMSIAQQQGLITNAQYADATNLVQSTLDPTKNFIRTAPAQREQVAQWLVKGLNFLNPNSMVTTQPQQKIYSFSDWQNVSAENAEAVELVTSKGIMQGLSNGTFNPKGGLTRAEMAQVLRNMDSIYYNGSGIQSKYGTVGGIRDVQLNETGKAGIARNLYIRNQDGQVDVLQYQMESSSSPQALNKDTVVYKNGQVSGLASLQEGDEIEYLVNTAGQTVLYVNAKNQLIAKTVQGNLEQIDYATGQIHITDSLKKRFVYSVVKGLYGNENSQNYIIIDDKRKYDNEVPYGSRIELSLKNDIVDSIKYIGEPTIVAETRGIVVENNEGFGYLTIIDNNGNEVTKNYYSDSITVEKQQYYDMSDEVGYIDQVFPNFQYDPRDTIISDVEPGDIVFIRTSPDDPEAIESISASPNYTMKYGKIREINKNGNVDQVLVEYEDKQTSWFDVADSIFISKSGKPVNMSDVEVGDWAKLLVNQAIISPGYVMESVKEINIEGAGHEISNIIKGQLGAVNLIQNQISIQNAQELSKNGWTDYQEIKQLNIGGNDIEYYHEGKRVPFDYVTQYLKRADGEVYVALENNYAGEKVAMVSFRNGRDDVLSPDTIVNSDGVGNFNIVGNNGTISTDAGTIVRRHGRLVSGQNIMIPDYATVVLNGNNKAAVVDIYDQPDTSGAMLIRGRILSVDEGKSFKVQSMSLLSDMKWVYTPVQREFSIDYNTKFITGDGIVDQNTFTDYGTDTSVNKVYNVITDGTKATHVIDSPYTKEAVRGTIYNTSDTSVSIKDGKYYNSKTGVWSVVSNTDNAVNVTTANNTVVIKNNQVVGLSSLENGDQIKVMVDKLPDKVTGSMTVNGYIILVEK